MIKIENVILSTKILNVKKKWLKIKTSETDWKLLFFVCAEITTTENNY